MMYIPQFLTAIAGCVIIVTASLGVRIERWEYIVAAAACVIWALLAAWYQKIASR
jgi:hypothetical protein